MRQQLRCPSHSPIDSFIHSFCEYFSYFLLCVCFCFYFFFTVNCWKVQVGAYCVASESCQGSLATHTHTCVHFKVGPSSCMHMQNCVCVVVCVWKCCASSHKWCATALQCHLGAITNNSCDYIVAITIIHANAHIYYIYSTVINKNNKLISTETFNTFS